MGNGVAEADAVALGTGVALSAVEALGCGVGEATASPDGELDEAAANRGGSAKGRSHQQRRGEQDPPGRRAAPIAADVRFAFEPREEGLVEGLTALPALRASGKDGSAHHRSLVWSSVGATKGLTRLREEGLGRLFRATNGGCDLAHWHLVEVAQDHDDPLLAGELGEGGSTPDRSSGSTRHQTGGTVRTDAQLALVSRRDLR